MLHVSCCTFVLLLILLHFFSFIVSVHCLLPRIAYKKPKSAQNRTEMRKKRFCAIFGKIRDKFLHRGFCTSGTRIRARILGNEFWAPEFWTRIPGSNFLSLFFPAKEAPRKIHPQEIHLSKFTFQNSTQKSGQKIHIAPLQGLLTEEKSKPGGFSEGGFFK